MTPREFRAMARKSFDEACEKAGMESSDALFKEAMEQDPYFRQQLAKLEAKHADQPDKKKLAVAIQRP